MLFLPLFPLNLVAYPTQSLNLHIFEPRYRQLINECWEQQTTFGIPAYIAGKLMPYGCQMQITEIVKRYDDGKMDIKTEGLRVIKLLTFENPAPNRLYAGGEVEVIADVAAPIEPLSGLINRLQRLYEALQVNNTYDVSARYFSYTIGHKVGFSIEQEYEMLRIDSELERQQYIIQHLDNALPIVSEMERTKGIIRMNGHFKNLDPLSF